MIKISEKNNKKYIKISKKTWQQIGKKAGWGQDVLTVLDNFNPNTDIFDIQTPWYGKGTGSSPRSNKNYPESELTNTKDSAERELNSGEDIYSQTRKDTENPLEVNDPVYIKQDDGTKLKGKINKINFDKSYEIKFMDGNLKILQRPEFYRP